MGLERSPRSVHGWARPAAPAFDSLTCDLSAVALAGLSHSPGAGQLLTVTTPTGVSEVTSPAIGLNINRGDADTASVPLQWRYLVALGVAILALAAYLAVPKGSTAPPQVSQRQIHAMEGAALQRLRLPHDFTRSNKGCTAGLCYVTSARAGEVEALMPQLLRSAGMQPPGSFRAAEPVAQLKAAHWSTASRDPLVIACKRVSASPSDPLEMCQDAGRVGPTLVNVLIRPEIACRKRECVDLRRTQVIAWAAALPNGV